MSIGALASARLTVSAWHCRLAAGVIDVIVGWHWQQASGTGWPPDAMRLSERRTKRLHI